MKCNGYVCDVCKRHCERYDDVVRLKARSGKFVSYENMEDWFADRKRLDVCTKCIADFRAFVKERRSE